MGGEARESCQNTSEVDLMVELEFTRVTRAGALQPEGVWAALCSELCSLASEKQCLA